ncbi:MAG TPA: L-histidine N(alpha)-methyltransferase [Bacteroidota bacterium]|jgi:dimethylhistidine N-methyltransferase
MSGYKVLHDSDTQDSFGRRDAFALDVLNGLSAIPKSLLSKYFYDGIGSRLFQRITELEEYYPTRSELEILQNNKEEIARYVDYAPINLVELGAGFSQKTTTLLKHFMDSGVDFRYVPIDISESAMKSLVETLGRHLPTLEVNGIIADYFTGMKWLNNRSGRKNLVMFLGSSIGNFSNGDVGTFLRSVWSCLKHDDLMLIGFDLKKGIDMLIRAYNDKEGVTRDFNLNLLNRINRELGGQFDLSTFRHFGTYNVFSGAMESYLISLKKQTVFIEQIGRTFDFEPWEPIHTEFSQKYLVSDIDGMAKANGFEVFEHFFDSKYYFADSMWRVHKPTKPSRKQVPDRKGITLVR